MPYEARKSADSDNWEVINAESAEVKATHEQPDAQEKAETQAERLNELEKEI